MSPLLTPCNPCVAKSSRFFSPPRRFYHLLFILVLSCAKMSNCSTRSSSRVGRVPEKIRKSPPKKPATAKIKVTKIQEDTIEYDIKVISTCRCEVPHRALCHFIGYNKSDDEWRPFHEMSEAAVGIAVTGPTKCSPKYCQRRKILLSSGTPDSLV